MGFLSYFLSSNYFHFVSRLHKQRGIAVLMYHRIRDDLPPGPLIVPSKAFREQMKYLKTYTNVISVKQLLQYYVEGRPIPPSSKPMVVITIDDGYRDTYVNAFPVLKEFSLQAAVFLATDFIGTGKKMARYSHLTGVDMLSWQEVGQMQDSGFITFAAHTETHPDLTKLIYAQQKSEIAGSIKTVYQRLSEDAARTVFCYTYGRYNDDTLKILRELDMKIAFTVQSGRNTGIENPLELKRICADGGHPLLHFMRELNPLPPWIQWRIDVIRNFFKKFRKET
jgi:peptidoglycan/xylan/chitin deacetylase (PgdA/CDA1 family)